MLQNPEVMLLMDIHRDGVGTTSASGRALTTATVNERRAGQIMFVISSSHGNWLKNQRIANDLHNLLENKYPGLSRGILVRRNATYNQDLHPAAILVEIGGHWNTLEEAIYGAELLAEILVDYYGGASGP
jgi:stage II sporulation protein P